MLLPLNIWRIGKIIPKTLQISPAAILCTYYPPFLCDIPPLSLLIIQQISAKLLVQETI